LAALIRRQDVVILHDPQTAGLIPPLKATGAVVVWRSHVGGESVNEYVKRGWEFLRPFVAAADAYVFSRHAYVPPELSGDHVGIIPPSIDPFSPKNQDLEPEVIRAILRHVGLVGGAKGDAAPVFRRFDGSSARVERHCDVQSTAASHRLLPLSVRPSTQARLARRPRRAIWVVRGSDSPVRARLRRTDRRVPGHIPPAGFPRRDRDSGRWRARSRG